MSPSRFVFDPIDDTQREQLNLMFSMFDARPDVLEHLDDQARDLMLTAAVNHALRAVNLLQHAARISSDNEQVDDLAAQLDALVTELGDRLGPRLGYSL